MPQGLAMRLDTGQPNVKFLSFTRFDKSQADHWPCAPTIIITLKTPLPTSRNEAQMQGGRPVSWLPPLFHKLWEEACQMESFPLCRNEASHIPKRISIIMYPHHCLPSFSRRYIFHTPNTHAFFEPCGIKGLPCNKSIAFSASIMYYHCCVPSTLKVPRLPGLLC